MSADVVSGSSYVIENVKAGTVIDLSAGDNKTGTVPFLALLSIFNDLDFGWILLMFKIFIHSYWLGL